MMTNLSTFIHSTRSLECIDIDSFLPALKITHIFQLTNTNSIFLLMVYPLEMIIIIVSVIGFFFVQKWSNPAKIYYYSISIFNVIRFLF